MTVYEVDEEGFFIESYLVSNDVEINQLVNMGKRIVKDRWNERLFEPKYDFETSTWAEGLIPEEVAEKEKGIEDYHSKIPDEEMNAIAIMELTKLVLGR